MKITHPVACWELEFTGSGKADGSQRGQENVTTGKWEDLIFQ